MARNTVLVRGNAQEIKGTATSSVITPGNLLVMSGASDGWARHGAGGVVAPIAFARENRENNGDGTTDNIAENSTFTVLLPENGARINATSTDTLVRGDEVTAGAVGVIVL